MKLKIETYESGDLQIGKMSKKAWESIPSNKRPALYPDSIFFIGDLERPAVTIKVIDDVSLDENTIYIHQSAKQLYYPNKELITL
ncbi:hypothetical protein K7J14_12570 [Treponema zuelzerae]|uniref:Uncharacterized protein n=1 Tax=Teretinema zuelzerae TaxID=156 RepID=A0AAE3JJK2_9SPIR|nr:hypothetical protein [Teretinema zuelzerae]MCD1655526.1 hypothetical protein [Teretinema zuelzerae]